MTAKKRPEVSGFRPEYDTFPLVLAILIVVLNSFVLYLAVRMRYLRTVTNFILGSLAFLEVLNIVLGTPLYLACSAIRNTVTCGTLLFFIRTFFIRTSRLRLAKILRTC